MSGLDNLFKTEEACAARDIFYFIADESIGERTLRKTWESANLGLRKRKLAGALQYAREIRDHLHAGIDGRSSTIQHVFLKFLELAELREENVPDGGGQVVLFNMGRFSQVISDWESINFNSDPFDSFQGFAKFLFYQAEGSYSEGWEDVDYMVPDAVQVMTVHQAKGREWPAVFMPALLRNRFPSISKKSPLWNLIPREAVMNSERYDGSKDDERRLFYVAMTRSMKFLHMTWAPIEGKNDSLVKTRFEEVAAL